MYHLDILANDIYKLIDEKKAMYAGIKGMEPYLAYLDYCRYLVKGKRDNMTALFLLGNAIADKERKYVRQVSKADPETRRKIRILQDEAYQRKYGIRFINSTLTEVYHPANRWRIHKDTPFSDVINRCHTNTLITQYFSLVDHTPSEEESLINLLWSMKFSKPEPSETEYIMLEERPDGDHAYILDTTTGNRYEPDSNHWTRLLSCRIPYRIETKDDFYEFIAIVLRELSGTGLAA